MGILATLVAVLFALNIYLLQRMQESNRRTNKLIRIVRHQAKRLNYTRADVANAMHELGVAIGEAVVRKNAQVQVDQPDLFN